MQIHSIAKSLKEITADTALPLAKLLTGGLHHGARASRTALRPFGLLSVEEVERVSNSSGVSLVTYEVTLSVYVKELVGTAGSILETFHKYWDRITSLPALDPDVARLVLIHPGASELGEAAEEDLGSDIVLGITTWEIQLSEHNPELGA